MITYLKKHWIAGGFQRAEVIIAFGFFLAIIPALRGISVQSDIDIFYGAALRLRQGSNMYLAPYMYGMWYYYSPLFASILVPFTWLDIRILKVCWHLFNLFLVFRSYRLFCWYLPIPKAKSGILLVSTLSLLAIPAVFLNLLYGQLTILVLWCCIEGVYRFLKNENTKGSLAFALGINIKVLPIFFFYSFLLKQNWKRLLYLFLAVGFLLLLPFLWLNFSFHKEIIQDWLNLLNPLNKEHIETIGEGGFTDFASVLIKYATLQKIPNETSLNIISLNTLQVFWIQMVFRFLVLILTAWVILNLHAKTFTGRIKEFADLGFILACIPTAFPHQRDYSMLLCLPSAFLLFFSWLVLKSKISSWVIVFLLLDMVLISYVNFLEFFGGPMKFFLHQSRISGFGALFFLPLYVLWFKSQKVKLL